MEHYDPTIEDSYRKTLKLPSSNTNVTVEIIDTAGTDQFEAMRELYLKTGDGFILVYSVTSKASLREAQDIYKQIYRVRGQVMIHFIHLLQSVPLILVGNKSDVLLREVNKQDGVVAARSIGCPHCETSARTGEGVSETFETLIQQIVTFKSNVGVETAQKETKSLCCCVQ